MIGSTARIISEITSRFPARLAQPFPRIGNRNASFFRTLERFAVHFPKAWTFVFDLFQALENPARHLGTGFLCWKSSPL